METNTQPKQKVRGRTLTSGILGLIIYGGLSVLFGICTFYGIKFTVMMVNEITIDSGTVNSIEKLMADAFSGFASGLGIIAGIIMILFFAVPLVGSVMCFFASITAIKRSKLPVEEFEENKGGLIFYIVVQFILSFICGTVAIASEELLFLIPALIPTVLAILLIVDFSKNRKMIDKQRETPKIIDVGAVEEDNFAQTLEVQLSKYLKLKNDGVITQEEYEKLRMKEIAKFNENN